MAPEDFARGLKTIELLAKDDQQCKDFVSLTTVSDEEGKKTLVCFWPKTGMTCTVRAHDERTTFCGNRPR